MGSKIMDRITLQFYEDEISDHILLNILNQTPKRNRAYKCKESLLQYFKVNYPDIYNDSLDRAQGGSKTPEEQSVIKVVNDSLKTNIEQFESVSTSNDKQDIPEGKVEKTSSVEHIDEPSETESKKGKYANISWTKE